MTDEYLINLWVEFKTDSVERRLQIAEELREFFSVDEVEYNNIKHLLWETEHEH